MREPVRNMDYDKEKERDKKYGDSTKELDGYVGFANLPNQVYRKSVKRGFDFTLMVVGRYNSEIYTFGMYLYAVTRAST